MAGTQRQQRVQEQIKEVITEVLPTMRDPRIGFVTVTGVEVAPDLSYARVYCSVYGSPEAQQEAIEALRNGAGYVRREVARRVQLRHTPEMDFRLDTTPERADRIMRLLNEIKQEDEARGASGRLAPGYDNVGSADTDADTGAEGPAAKESGRN